MAELLPACAEVIPKVWSAWRMDQTIDLHWLSEEGAGVEACCAAEGDAAAIPSDMARQIYWVFI